MMNNYGISNLDLTSYGTMNELVTANSTKCVLNFSLFA